MSDIFQSSAAVPHYEGMAALIENYDAFILDVWGVLHDGVTLYPGAVDTLERLTEAGKPFVMLTNAPRRSAAVARPNTFSRREMDKLARTARARSHGRCRTHGRDSRVRRRGESRRAGVRYVDHWIFPYLDDTRDHLSFGRHPVHVAHAFPLLRFQQTATARWWTPWGPSTWLTCRRARSSA